MNQNLKNKTAFSLIELSVVILIIGVIVAGVTQSSRMISAFKLSTARNLTQSSPVASMKNLVLWYETTSVASFDDAQADNGLTVTQWKDINPTSTTKYNTTGGNGATYTTNCMNSLPCLRFNGSSNYFTYDGTFLAGTDYTVVVVEQRRSGAYNFNMFIFGSTAAGNSNLQLGYRTNTLITFAQYANDLDISVAAYSNPIPRIHVFRYSSTAGKGHYLNGVGNLLTTGGGLTGLTSNAGSAIGYAAAGVNTYFTGDLCEIIMFNRAITTEERDVIEVYLGKKWGITVI